MQKFDKQTDDQLVAAYAKGNNDAFDALLQRHQTRVYNYIYQMVRERSLAEDIFPGEAGE